MNKKTLAVILEIIPIVSTIVFFIITFSNMNSVLLKTINAVAVVVALLGFVFFIIGRILGKGSKPALFLGILDILCTATVVGFYTLAIFLFGL